MLAPNADVFPFIEVEEAKIPGELGKVLDVEAEVAVAVNRVPVVDGQVSVGRVREAPPHDVALTVVVHNTMRGAAGACMENAELCLARGFLSAWRGASSRARPSAR